MGELICKYGKLSTKHCQLCNQQTLYEIQYEPGVSFTACHHCDCSTTERV